MGAPSDPRPTVEADAGRREQMVGALVSLARARAPDRTICPSEAARAVGGATWRDEMPLARETARDLARRGVVEVSQRGVVLDPDDEWRGPVRIRHLGT